MDVSEVKGRFGQEQADRGGSGKLAARPLRPGCSVGREPPYVVFVVVPELRGGKMTLKVVVSRSKAASNGRLSLVMKPLSTSVLPLWQSCFT